MSRQHDWRIHAPSGKKYYLCQLNGQTGYHFEDGRKLTQRQFDQLTNYQDPQTVPRSTPQVSGTKDSRTIQLKRTNPGHTDTGQLPPHTDSNPFPEPVVGSPSSRNYVVAPGSASIQLEPHRRGPAYVSARQGTTVYTSDRNSNRHSEQPSVSVGELPRHDNKSAGTSLPPRLSQLSRDFVRIPMGEYADLYSFVVNNPEILFHSEIDNLINEARIQESVGNRVYPQTFVHHAILLRRCREIDPIKYSEFFKRLAGDSDVRQQFVKSVKAVYAKIQDQARVAIQQPQIPSAQNQDRGVPLVVQQSTQMDRHDANQPPPERKISIPTQPEAQSRREAGLEDRATLDLSTRTYKVQDDDGRWVYRDESGRFLRPARSRNEPKRHQRDSDAADMETRMARLSTGAPTHDIQGQNAISINVEATDRTETGPPPNRRTSVSSTGRLPTLQEGKAGAGRVFKGTDGDVETLDPRYEKRSDAKRFFTRGRVFSLLWHEPAGQNKTDMSKPIRVTRGRFGGEIFSHILRMVVVKEFHGACWCLPVNTYGGRGVSKPGFSKEDREAHSIIYMSDTTPKKLSTEIDMNKKPIAVDKSSPDQKLDEMSRINFSRVHTVNWNVKVMDVGQVARESMPSLVTYWNQTLQ